MNPREKGFLLLTGHLGDPARRPLSAAQLRLLSQRVQLMQPDVSQREMVAEDFVRLGYSRDMAQRILALLEEEAVLDHYCAQGKRQGCIPVTRVSQGYPLQLRQRLGMEAPGCLWAKGDLSLLEKAAVSLVGSRDLYAENRVFAREVGQLAARNGWVLASGNARGADREAQNACLAAGGQVICIVADRLSDQMPREGVLYLSEDGFDEAFSSQRALSRNRCIHALGAITFVAQAGLGKGGTWDGTVKNLRHDWSPVICFRDGSPASLELEQMGAYLLDREELKDFSGIPQLETSMFD